MSGVHLLRLGFLLRLLSATMAAILVAALLSACAGVSPDAAGTSAPNVARVATIAPPQARSREPAPAGGVTPSVQRADVDRIEVSKCWTNATASTGGQLLISAKSSDPSAHLLAYREDGALIGEVHNGGGQRYGGTVFPYQATDPGTVTIRSSSGGSVTVPTTPFHPED